MPQEPVLPSNLPLAQTRLATAAPQENQATVTTTSGIVLPAGTPPAAQPAAPPAAPANTAASTANTANMASPSVPATLANQGPSVSMPPALPPETNPVIRAVPAAQGAAAPPVTSTTAAPVVVPAQTAAPVVVPAQTAAPVITTTTTTTVPPTVVVPTTVTPLSSIPVTRDPAIVELEGSPVVSGRSYRIQVGSFTKASNAVEVFDRLSSTGLNPSYERYNEYYRVVITSVRGEDMPSVSQKLAAAGITKALAREEVPPR